MSSHRAWFVVCVPAALSLIGAGAFAVGCSSESTPADTGADASPEGGGHTGLPAHEAGTGDGTDGGDGGATTEQCVAACEAKYAAGLTKDKAIDQCWAQSCKGPCVDGTGMFDGGVSDGGDAGAMDDAGDGGDGGGASCQNGVETGDPACNACTAAFCCGAWDGCFQDKDCAALNDCRSNCP